MNAIKLLILCGIVFCVIKIVSRLRNRDGQEQPPEQGKYTPERRTTMAFGSKTAVRAVVLGVRSAEQTKVLATYNSTMYSLLVEYSDGSRELLELDAKGMKPYLKLIRM